MEVDDSYFCIYLCFIFIFGITIIQFLALKISFNKNYWKTILNINVMRSGSYKYKHIFTFCSDNNDSLNQIKHLESFFDIGKKFYFNDEIQKINYEKFNIEKINLAHRNMLKKVMQEDDSCAIVQNMRKPRDFFDLYCYVLMSKRNENILIHIESYCGTISLTSNKENTNNLYVSNEYSMKNVIEDGGHLMYYKKNRKREIEINMKLVDDKKIFYGKGDFGDGYKFLDNIKNYFFEVNIYELNNRDDFGIEVIENKLNIDDKYIYRIGQYYLI